MTGEPAPTDVQIPHEIVFRITHKSLEFISNGLPWFVNDDTICSHDLYPFPRRQKSKSHFIASLVLHRKSEKTISEKKKTKNIYQQDLLTGRSESHLGFHYRSLFTCNLPSCAGGGQAIFKLKWKYRWGLRRYSGLPSPTCLYEPWCR